MHNGKNFKFKKLSFFNSFFSFYIRPMTQGQVVSKDLKTMGNFTELTSNDWLCFLYNNFYQFLCQIIKNQHKVGFNILKYMYFL